MTSHPDRGHHRTEDPEHDILESLARAAFQARDLSWSGSPTPPDTATIDDFLAEYGKDREAGEVQTLEAYLALFPGRSNAIAKEFLILEEGTDLGSGIAAFASGERLGPYQTQRELGRGGQAVVYLAEDQRLHRRVALKILNHLEPGTESLLERFRREAEVASKLQHPGICSIYDAGIERGVPYIAMACVEGESLAQRLATLRTHAPVTGESSVSREEVLRITEILEDTARALHVAHEAGVIHRDIKPSNIMIAKDGRPVILDFGLARTESADLPTLTLSGELFGTPAYMSPEQLTQAAHHVDARADVWSLGVTLYECLTLRRPFEAPTREGLFQAIQSQDPPDPRSLNAAGASDLRVVLETALDKDRDRRYQTALDFAEDLRRVREYEPIAAKPASTWIKLKRWAQRNPALAGSVSAGFLFLSIGLVVSLTLLLQRDAALTRYDQMSDVALVVELRARADELWPRRPRMLPAMAQWLKEAQELYGRLPLHEAALQKLRDRAAPYDAAQQQADAQNRKKVCADLFDAIAAKRKEISEAEEDVTQLRRQIKEIETRIKEEAGAGIVRRHEKRLEQCEIQVEELQAKIANLQEQAERQERDPRLTERLTWRLLDLTDRWRHQVLSGMARTLGGFGELIEDVEARKSFAETIETRSIDDHQPAWDRCLLDVATNPKYADSVNLRSMKPQIGLVPLGIDRDSGLWEFWHVGSGERPGWEDSPWTAGASADPRGKVQITGVSGIVLVLLPGGSFWMGATKELGAQNHDPEANADEGRVHEIAIDAFFMAKYELTQAQWQRLMNDIPSHHRAGGRNYLGGIITPRHPVTNVDWEHCREAMLRWDLELPTEARWAYACRAGTSTVYWCGDSVASIQNRKAGNIADKTASCTHFFWACTTEVDDGHVVHAPVGSFAANAFGLHDVLGNVWEWCEDRYCSYEQAARPGDGLRDEPGSRCRVARGGSFRDPALGGRSALRGDDAPSFRDYILGCRPARGSTLWSSGSQD